MKLHRDLNITQKAAWYLAHRIREGMKENPHESEFFLFEGPVEVDETYIGGRESNMHYSKKKKGNHGPVGKFAVMGAKNRDTNTVIAQVIDTVDEVAAQDFIDERVERNAMVYTDGSLIYWNLHGYGHEAVIHLHHEYVRGDCYTNGIESFWAMIKRGYMGVYHKMSRKHLPRYIKEFVARQNMRHQDTINQMKRIAECFEGQRLRYCELVA